MAEEARISLEDIIDADGLTNEEVCGNCKHWHRDDAIWEDGDHDPSSLLARSVCRRFPPVVIRKDNPDLENVNSAFPQTYHLDRCGEFSEEAE